jgi:hypothetical protein
LLTETNQRLHAIDQGLSKNPDETTKGYLLVNKAMLLADSGRKEEATQLLENMMLPESIATNILLAKMTLNMIQQEGEKGKNDTIWCRLKSQIVRKFFMRPSSKQQKTRRN